MTDKQANNVASNWYPGHMAKFRRILIDQLKSVDAVIELCDARAPSATRNPDLEKLTKDKARILVLNKADLADAINRDEEFAGKRKTQKEYAEEFGVSDRTIRGWMRELEEDI